MKSTNLVLVAVGVFFAATALADGNFKSKVDYANQNGCRVFDAIVSPNCPYDLAPRTCAISQSALKKIAEENPSLTLKTFCWRLHTGNLAKRILAESLMHSPSFDGYTIKMNLNSKVRGEPLKIATSFVDADTCSLASNALKSFDKKGLSVTSNCTGEKLTAQLQF
jgi:hypothetical protein